MSRLSAARKLSLLGAGMLCFLTWSGCRPAADAPATQETTVVGTDYAFDAPEVMPAGRTAFAFDNRGNVPHEMILVRLKEGLTTQDVLTQMQAGASPEELVDGGAHILIAGPGETTPGRILLNLERGREYALVCNFRDNPEAPQHTELGMFRGIRVE
jgi:hypothetical protein